MSTTAIPVLPDLPVREVLPALQQALAAGRAAVLVAPPGSGKTTLVPLTLLGAPWLAGQRILLLEPRRLAARACAARMAALLGEDCGGQVGYQVRFDRRIGPQTRVEVVTEGILTRRLQLDPALEGVGLLVFDEFHERSLHADLGLALALEVQADLRPDLRILVMSATLDAAAVATLLNGAAVIEGQGRSHSVDIRYSQRTPLRPDLELAAGRVIDALEGQPGDVLVFLPGVSEIRALEAALRPVCPGEVELTPLYGDLGAAAQDAALQPRAARRRVVLATDIAETSLTIEGVSTVVDLGWCRQPRFDPNRGVSRLETVRVSRAAADQRAGRAGRLGPGVCYRLWREQDQAGLEAQRPAEIRTSDLGQLVLELAQWGVRERLALNWLDPPPPAAWAQARDLLVDLDAVTPAGAITATGQRMVELGAHPRLAHLLQIGAAQGQAGAAADLAALLSERDPLRPVPGLPRPVDLELRLQALADWRARTRHAGGTAYDPGALARIDRASRQYRQRLRMPKSGDSALSVGGLLALAYPDRVARRRPGSVGRFQLAGGRGARLAEDDPLAGQDWLVVAQLDAGRRDGRIYLAATLGLDELRVLQAQRIEMVDTQRWDPERAAVLARREERLGALVLSTQPLEQPDPARQQTVLCAGIRASGLACLPWSKAATQLRDRVAACRAWHPEAGWPDWSDSALLDTLPSWLGPYLEGCRRLDELRRLDLVAILAATLDWSQQQALEALAPAELKVPSGRRHRLDYADGGSPVLAVQLQELFGLAETPRVNGGRIPVTLHLLSPARRPVQVTRDLRGFWEHTYTEVRKELRIRYAKHHWPEDPWNAPPTARPKGKGRR